MNALTYIPVERPPAPVAMRFPAPRTPLDAKLRKTALRAFYRMWFREMAAFNDEAAFTDRTAEMALKLEIARCEKLAASELRDSKRIENIRRRHWCLLWNEQYRLRADAWRNLLNGDLIMWRLCFQEIRRVRQDIAAEQARVFPEMVS
jgi:hypothetical protein